MPRAAAPTAPPEPDAVCHAVPEPVAKHALQPIATMSVGQALAVADRPRAPHAWVVDDGRGSLTRQLVVLLAPAEETGKTATELLVVGGDALAVRVRVEDPSLRALAWFPRSSLAQTPTRRVALAASARDTEQPSESGVTLLPGARVELGRLDGTARHVSGTCDELGFEGWVPGDALGDVFEAEPEPRSVTVSGFVRGGTPVYSNPWAAPVGRFKRALPEIEVLVEPGGPPGFTAVAWTGERCIVHGLVDARDVTTGATQQLEIGRLSSVGFAAGGVSDAEPITLPRRTPLMTPDGERIGVTRMPTTAFVTSRHPGFCDATMLVPMLGFQDLRVPC